MTTRSMGGRYENRQWQIDDSQQLTTRQRSGVCVAVVDVKEVSLLPHQTSPEAKPKKSYIRNSLEESVTTISVIADTLTRGDSL